MSDDTQGAQQPQPGEAPNDIQPQQPHMANPQTYSADEQKRSQDGQPEGQKTQDPPHRPDDEMRKLLQDLAQTATVLGTRELALQENIAGLNVAAEKNPVLLQQQEFRRRVAYAVQDVERATGRQLLAHGPLATEMQQLATTMPGLENHVAIDLLKATPTIDDQGFVSEIRGAVRNLASVGDRQSLPQFKGIVDVLENRFRLYSTPNVDGALTRDAAQQHSIPLQQDTASPRQNTLGATLQRQAQQQAAGTPQQPRQTASMDITRRLRAPVPSGAEVVWPRPAESMKERILLFEARLVEGKTQRLVQDAEKSGSRAIEATEQFIQGPGRGILGKMESAASTEPGGMETVLEEMRPGGRYVNLRTEFDNAYQQDAIFRGAYDKVVASGTRFGRDREAVVNNYSQRNLDTAQLDGRFQSAEEALGEALSKVPGKQPGKSALDEMTEKLAEILRAATNHIRQLFGREASTDVRRGARPAPGMSM